MKNIVDRFYSEIEYLRNLLDENRIKLDTETIVDMVEEENIEITKENFETIVKRLGNFDTITVIESSYEELTIIVDILD